MKSLLTSKVVVTLQGLCGEKGCEAVWCVIKVTDRAISAAQPSVLGVVASGSASTVTSTSAPGFRRTLRPFSSVRVFSMRSSRYR